MKSKQTAVEWFQDQIIKIVNGTCELSEIQIFEQALAMEKEQIMRSHSSGYNSGLENKLVLSYEYYIKTFKKE